MSYLHPKEITLRCFRMCKQIQIMKRTNLDNGLPAGIFIVSFFGFKTPAFHAE